MLLSIPSAKRVNQHRSQSRSSCCSFANPSLNTNCISSAIWDFDDNMPSLLRAHLTAIGGCVAVQFLVESTPLKSPTSSEVRPTLKAFIDFFLSRMDSLGIDSDHVKEEEDHPVPKLRSSCTHTQESPIICYFTLATDALYTYHFG